MLINLRQTAYLDASYLLLPPTSSDVSIWQYYPSSCRPYSSSEFGFPPVRLGQYMRSRRFSVSVREPILDSVRYLLRASLLWTKSDYVLGSFSLWLLSLL